MRFRFDVENGYQKLKLCCTANQIHKKKKNCIINFELIAKTFQTVLFAS